MQGFLTGLKSQSRWPVALKIWSDISATGNRTKYSDACSCMPKKLFCYVLLLLPLKAHFSFGTQRVSFPEARPCTRMKLRQHMSPRLFHLQARCFRLLLVCWDTLSPPTPITSPNTWDCHFQARCFLLCLLVCRGQSVASNSIRRSKNCLLTLFPYLESFPPTGANPVKPFGLGRMINHLDKSNLPICIS